MTGASVTVDGADTLARSLSNVAEDLDALAPAGAGDVILRAARARAPRVSGRLRSSLDVATEPGVVTVFSELIYAPVIHWGWRARNIEPAHYLTEAADATQTEWAAVYRDETAAILRRDVKGA